VTKHPYTKPSKTYAEQVEILRSRGMIIDDVLKAELALRHLNYYRLCGYWLPFEQDHATHTFKLGTRFEHVIELYNFDRRLRLLVMDAIERIEVSVRGQWAHIVAQRHGPHAHLDPAFAEDKALWDKNLADLQKEVKRSDNENFIRHYQQRYQEPLPPIWVVCEVMSLGLLSKWYRNIQSLNTKAAIAGQYHVHSINFSSWLHHLTIIRNLCAHHSRLWDREFRTRPKINKPAILSSAHVRNSPKLYNTLLMLLYLMDVIEPGHDWRGRLQGLLGESTGVPLKAMGFPENWQEKAIWQGGAV
jgi:abortive infection bacteriophage resistance protein